MDEDYVGIVIAAVIAIVFGLVGVGIGMQAERSYQCDKVGGQMIGNHACIKGSEVVIRWR